MVPGFLVGFFCYGVYPYLCVALRLANGRVSRQGPSSQVDTIQSQSQMNSMIERKREVDVAVVVEGKDKVKYEEIKEDSEIKTQKKGSVSIE